MNKVCHWVVLLGYVFLFAALAVAGESSVESTVQTDPIFGEPYTVQYIDTEANNQFPSFHAALVKYPWKAHIAVPDTIKGGVYPKPAPKATVLYIHGFNDYFMQPEMGAKMDSAGYELYAIDLHKYGRAYRQGERIGELMDIAEYYAELDSAIDIITGKGTNGTEVVLMGHSTGGLIALMYAAHREKGQGLSAIVLNSPFLEMNYGFFARKLALPVLSLVGKYFPSVEIPRGKNTNYGESLHKDYRGEWDYSLDLKSLGSIPVNMGWIRAIHEAHKFIQNAPGIQTPILVMHSNCSVDEDEWDERYTHCDGVLNVEHIKEFGATLGPDVTDVEIQDGIHDLALSKKAARENYYKAVFQFLDNKIQGHH